MKRYYSSFFRKVAMISLITIFTLSPKAYALWTWQWNGTDKASYTSLFTEVAAASLPAPTSNDVFDDPTEVGTKALIYSIAPNATSSGNTFNYFKAFTGTTGVTLLMRIKGVNSTDNKIGDFEIRTPARLRIRLIIKSNGTSFGYAATANANFNYPAGIDALKDYQILRITYSAAGELNFYLNENPVPLFTEGAGLIASGTANSFHFGKSSSGNAIGYYQDWIVCDESGVYAPGVGTALPSEYTKSAVSKLSAITVNGTSIPAFSADTLTYNIGIASGSPVPTIDATALHQYLGETFTVTNATAIPGTSTINVTAQNGNTNTYTLHFLNGLSNDGTLKSVTVGSTTLAQFVPGTTTYDVKVASGATAPSVLTYTTNERYATAVVTDATTLPGTGTILVTAQDGSTKTYTFNMSAADITDATLTNIKVNGTTITGFDPATLTYNVELSAGTTAIPSVSYTKTDGNALATVVKTDATALPGSTTLLVTAADLTTAKTYTINFTVATTGVQTIKASDVKLTANSALTVEVPAALVNSKLYIYNISGALQTQQTIHKVKSEMDLSNFSKGVYLVKIIGNDGATLVKKFVKQ